MNLNKIECVIFDWAGTVVDYGCMAPVGAFTKVFANRGIDITIAEARAPMGLHKKKHIEEILKIERIKKIWEDKFGKPSTDADIQSLFQDFIPLQKDILIKYSKLIPGTLEIMHLLKENRVSIGCCTGYDREQVDLLLGPMKEQGFFPEIVMTSTDVEIGRPYPYMCYRIAEHFQLKTLANSVKVDDSPFGILEGHNAGMWTVGVTLSSNEVGMNQSEVDQLSLEDRKQLIRKAEEKFSAASPHFLIETIADLPSVLQQIDEQL